MLAGGDLSNQISLHADDLNAIGANRLGIGGLPAVLRSTTDSRRDNIATFTGNARSIVLREGAVLKAGEVFLVTGSKSGGIVIEQGAGINTLGQGKAAWDSMDGYVYDPSRLSVLAVSNGWLDLLPPAVGNDPNEGRAASTSARARRAPSATAPRNSIRKAPSPLPRTRASSCASTARYGTRNLTLAVGGINVGSAGVAGGCGRARDALTPACPSTRACWTACCAATPARAHRHWRTSS